MSDNEASDKKLSENNAADKQAVAKNNSSIADEFFSKKTE